MNDMELRDLVREFAALPKETEWMERKLNKAIPDEIGEYISALSNSAALHGKRCGYLLWGVDNDSREIVGTSFRPRNEKIGNQELENWLLTQLEPRIDVIMHEGEINGKNVVLLEIQAASYRPVRFRGVEYVRIGSYKKRLHDHPERERALWKLFDEIPFEEGVAKENASSDDVLELLDYPSYFTLMGQPLPDNRVAILERLASEKIIAPQANDRFDITNIGAILFARKLQDFDRLSRKALRVIIYRSVNRVETMKEQIGGKGYAIGFEGAISYINDQLPQNEYIGQALREEARMYPEIAIRELVANALIHQDFHVTGSGPMVEIFTDRMEISNPGIPLIDTLRFIDEPPRSRNEQLAGMMRRLRMCEERGSGIDKVIFSIEAYQLPAPDFRVAGNNTITVLFGHRDFSQMDREERIRACYQHTCLLYVSGKRMSNASLRVRLGIKDSNYPMASRIIRDTIASGLIKVYGEGGSSYMPFWA